MSESIKIKIDGQELLLSAGTRVRDVLEQHCPAWLKSSVGVALNDEPLDFQMALHANGELVPLKPSGNTSSMALQMCRHTTSHVLAQAVQELFEGVQVGIGPPTADGFYYDFFREDPFTPEDLQVIEKRMRRLIKTNQKLVRLEMSKGDAEKIFAEKGEDLKVELVRDKGGAQVSCYQQGNFIDFCTGPHLPHTGKIPAIKLLHTAAAHWRPERGREDSPMMQRIYGTAFFSAEDLKTFLDHREEAKKRDHRRLGIDLDLFHFDEKAGPGMAYWHPKGGTVRHQIEGFLCNEQLSRGYDVVYTPHIARKHLWETSGHYDYYKEHMFTLDVDEQAGGHVRGQDVA